MSSSLVSRSNLNLPYFLSYVAQFSVEREMFQIRTVENIKAHILYSITLFRKSFRLWENVEKFCRAGQATDDNVEHAHCMLDTWGYKYTPSISNTLCFSTATMVCAQTRLKCYVPLTMQLSGKVLQRSKCCISQNMQLQCCKGKSVPLQAWTGPEGASRLRLPNFKTVGMWGW